LTADYLATHVDRDTRLALAGRNRDKLETVRGRLAALGGERFADLPLLEAEIGDEASMQAVARSTRVVITTVGPYIHYGEPLVAACAAAGTDYVDLTGEPEFVDLMWLRHHETARRTGARIIHSCGFDSIPYDLGVLYAVGHLPEGVPLKVSGYLRAGGTFSGGTGASAVEAMGRLRQSVRTARLRRQREERPAGRRVHGEPGAPHRAAQAGGWAVPFPTIDPQTVLRSAAANDRYGPDFAYSHYLVVRRLPALVGLGAGVVSLVALAQLPPTRKLLLNAIKSPGEGPSEEQRAKGWFKVRIEGEGGGRRVVAQVSGGDPGYGDTAKMLAESALCLAGDELPPTAGQVTPAVALGEPLIGRLQAAGIRFEVLDG
jgi:short subunit dehydrogenase-like uncharacterized protein